MTAEPQNLCKPFAVPVDVETNHRSPLPYHYAIRDYLKREESEIWQWYASQRVRSEQAEAIRFDLLKSTYRIDPDAHPTIYELVSQVSNQLDLDLPVTLYQAQNPQGLNASTAFLPDEAHIILHGPVASKLSQTELLGLLAHEFGHLLLFHHEQGELLIVDQVLSAMTHDRQADTPHFASARLFALYTEVFCDRIALEVTKSPGEVISMLVKVATDVDDVDPASYLKQAAEILSRGPIKAEGNSHPEAYLRAHVLQLWHEEGADSETRIIELIEGQPDFDELDLTGQVRVMETTRNLIDAVLAPQWFQTDLVLAHARLFFDQYRPADPPPLESLRAIVEKSHKSLQDYFCYLLLDFASADRELEELPVAQTIAVADALGLSATFRELATKELRLRKKQFDKIAADRDQILSAAARTVDAP